jgi:hypothetical protein
MDSAEILKDEIFKKWIAAINSHDVAVLASLMARVHAFVAGDTVLATGEAGGTIDGERWKIPPRLGRQ